MHERHALHHGFLVEPSTVEELLAALPEGQLFPQLHLGDTRSEEMLDKAMRRLLAYPWATAATLAGAAGGLYVYWGSCEFFVEGVLYPSRRTADETSPVVLVHRFDRTLVYGPDVVHLAMQILGTALASVALGGPANDRDLRHQDVFDYAPWPDLGSEEWGPRSEA